VITTRSSCSQIGSSGSPSPDGTSTW
jgi:hypothetical protein